MVRWRSPLRKEEPGDRKGKAAAIGHTAEVVKVAQPKSTPRAVVPAKRPTSDPPPHFADDLIHRVIVTIDEWAAANGLSGLPRKVIFEQALAIMTALYENSSGSKPGGDKR